MLRKVASVATEIVKSLRSLSAIEVAMNNFGRDNNFGRKTGDVWVDERTGITYVWISAGTFLMGDGKEQHDVEITQPFWMARYPVTNSQYRRFLHELGEKAKKPAYWDERRFNGDDQPVVGVSWDEAEAFAKWAGEDVRLPTEAQCEYACRAGSKGDFCFGNGEKKLGDYAWYQDNSHRQTQPVGAKLANDWGLHDMHGNVWEWCEDVIAGSNRVGRGGSWRYSAWYCRSAFRDRNTPGNRDSNLGFRVATVPGTGPASKSRSQERST